MFRTLTGQIIGPNTLKSGGGKKSLVSYTDGPPTACANLYDLGISMLFLAIDMSGGLFSVLSLVFKPTFDVVAALTYLAVIVSRHLSVLLHRL